MTEVEAVKCPTTGAPIIEPGIYQGLPNEEYHGAAGISKSALDKIAECPAKYKYQYIDGNLGEETQAMIVGRATHAAVFEPDVFEREYIVSPVEKRVSKKDKEAYARCAADNPEKTILSTKDYDTVWGVKESVRSHPKVKEFFARAGGFEISFFHDDAESGEILKARTDWLQDDVVFDLKSTVSAEPGTFSRHAHTYRYDVQAAFYPYVINKVYGKRAVEHFVFIAVEKTPPYLVGVYFASKRFIECGQIRFEQDLATLAMCKAENWWPSYNGDRIAEMSLPKYAEQQIRS